jgi:hypothetical protein
MRALCHFASLFKLHFLRLCALVCLLLPVSSWAIDHILEKAYWTDSTANASFEQARVASYTPYANLLSKGYSPSAQWVWLNIQGAAGGHHPLNTPRRLTLLKLNAINWYSANFADWTTFTFARRLYLKRHT